MKIWVGTTITCALLAVSAFIAYLNSRERKEEEAFDERVKQFDQKEEMRKNMQRYTGFY